MTLHRSIIVGLLLPLTLAACARPRARPPVGPAPLAATTVLIEAPPAAVGLDPALPARLDSLVEAALADRMAPGAVLAVGRHGRLVHLRGYGRVDWAPDAPAASATTIYDLASLTKVVGTTTAAMLLEEDGDLALDSTLAWHLPDWDAPDKAAITVRMLLEHRGGLEAGAPLHRTARGRDAYLAGIAARPLRSVPGTRTVYSDWDMVLLGLALEHLACTPLDSLLARRVFAPLGMRDTGFLPDSARRLRAAPTATDTARGGALRGVLRGVVHDGNAWAIGGVSGHAGLFSTARDLAVFAQFLLDGGRYDTTRLLRPATIARWTAPQGPGASRALGWDTPAQNSSAGRYASPRAFGHTGFTGTSLWVDPERGLFIVLLANRVHPAGSSDRHVRLRREVSDAVHAAVRDVPLVDWEARSLSR